MYTSKRGYGYDLPNWHSLPRMYAMALQPPAFLEVEGGTESSCWVEGEWLVELKAI